MNIVTRTLITDVTHRLEDILERSGVPLQVEQDQPALFRGLFRHVLLLKIDAASQPPAPTHRAAP